MTTDPIQVLMIEDDPDDVLLMREFLTEAGALKIKLAHADRLSEGLKRIAEQKFDVILLDLNLPDSRGLDTLRDLLRQVTTIPVVVLSGLADDRTTLEAVRQGAQDYLVKGEMSGSIMARVLRYAIERKRGEKQLRHSNRALRMLSDCNQVMVQAADEAALLQQVCRIIVEVGGYRLAWVGYAGKDEGKTVQPMAQVGYEEGYLETLKLTWADTERGRGPTGTTIRSGRPTIAHNIQTDPAFAPWRAEALERGYASSIALPLGQDETFGALNIYAAEPEAFASPQELKLLVELTGDLAYGITTLRTRAERVQSQAELKAQKEFAFQVMNNMGEGLTVTNAEGKFEFVNSTYARMLGYSPQELIGKSFMEFAILEDQAAQGQAWTRRAQGETTVYEVRLQRADGITFPVSITGVPQFQDGKFAGSIAVITDLTERKRAEKSLIESEKNYRTLFENMPVGLYRITPDGRMLDVNPALVNMFGFHDRDALLALNAEDLYADPADNTEFFEAIRQSDIVSNFETEMRRQDGSTFWTSDNIRINRDDQGSVLSYEGSMVDITERKQAEAAIQRRDRILESLAYAGEQLLRSTVLEEHLPNILSRLGEAVEISRVYIFENHSGADGELLTSQRYEWVNAGFMPQVDNPHLQNFHLAANGFGRWIEIMEQGGTIHGNIREFPESERDVLSAQEIQSILVVPIFVGGKWWGFIGFDDCLDEREWFAIEIEALKTAAGTLGAAIQRKRDEYALEQRARELQTLYETSLEINAQASLDALLSSIVERASSLLNASGGGLYLMEPDGESLKLVVGHNLPQEYIGVTLKLGEGLSGRVAQSGKPMFVEDYQTWPRRANVYNDTPFRRVLGIPLKIKERVIGVINVSDFTRTGSFSEDEVRLVSLFAEQAALAIENTHLFEHAERRLRRTEALHTIDMAITSSFDLRLTLGVVLDQVTAQLKVDAADVLLLDPHLQTLEFSAGRGFRSKAIERSHLQLGEGYTGRAALERPTHTLSNLAEVNDFSRATLVAGEGFVSYYAVPLTAKGQSKGVLEIFNRTPLDPDPEWLNFLETLAGQAAIAVDNATLFKNLQLSIAELSMAYDATIAGWSHAMDLRDEETQNHTLRVTEMTESLARRMGIGDAELVHIRRGGLLHDIGKMGVPDDILLKPDELTEEEWALMRQHPQFAHDMLAPIPYLRPAMDIPYCHHEKWDGTGYPRGLKGEQIPLAARIFAVVDVYDALTSDRPYRKAWTQEKTLMHIREQSGTYFDPAVVDAFLASMAAAPKKKKT